jgi:hypothetical protein
MKNNTKLLSIICSILFAHYASAQFDSTKAISQRDKLVDSVCTCMAKTDSNSVNTPNDAQKMLTRCITNNMQLMIEYVEPAGIDLSKATQEKIQDVANYIASIVYRKCPAMRVLTERVKSKQE